MLFGKLTITYPDKRQRIFPLTKATIRIGRTSDNDVILDDERISRHHADILCSEDGLEVLDLGSTNGVHLGGFRIPTNQPVPVPDRSILELGRIRIRP
ncbi:MAG: FHA domain-containing protein [Chloroflexota bacterium]|nr:FHA domain-containing protein [Chloroflexota bacterium]